MQRICTNEHQESGTVGLNVFMLLIETLRDFSQSGCSEIGNEIVSFQARDIGINGTNVWRMY